MTCDDITVFTITGDTYTVEMAYPSYNSPQNRIDSSVKLFDFWSGRFDTRHDGISTEPVRINGFETLCGDNSAICFPLCFPICFKSALCTKFDKIDYMMENHEEITVSGLGDCFNGTYIIKNFSYSSMDRVRDAIRWSLTLELVRR